MSHHRIFDVLKAEACLDINDWNTYERMCVTVLNMLIQSKSTIIVIFFFFRLFYSSINTY